MTLKEFLTAVGKNEKDMANPSYEETMAAVKQDGEALRYFKNQTPELCMAAVKQDCLALRLVKDQTPELCMAAVEQDGEAIKFVDKSIFENEKEKQTVNDTKKGSEVFFIRGGRIKTAEVIDWCFMTNKDRINTFFYVIDKEDGERFIISEFSVFDKYRDANNLLCKILYEDKQGENND